MGKQSLFKTPKLTLTNIKTHGVYCDPCSIKRNQSFKRNICYPCRFESVSFL
ncbi:hypothetical protein HPHPP1_0219 [Helicobacter pylori Hp P-1]|nr:hypothetical protein HPHPP1_0219 [Helicobacter pylori Hp P-1]EJC22678.1 hypothetical protein HPHPP1B_0243 [Helicobacter pylori Hp P-1b]